MHTPVIDDVDRNYGEALFKLRQPAGGPLQTAAACRRPSSNCGSLQAGQLRAKTHYVY